MAKFSADVNYGNSFINVQTEDFKDLHICISRISELHGEYLNLCKVSGIDPQNVYPSYRRTGEKLEFEYFEFADKVSGKSLTFGENKDKANLVPLFPKGRDGYYDPAKDPKRNQNT